MGSKTRQERLRRDDLLTQTYHTGLVHFPRKRLGDRRRRLRSLRPAAADVERIICASAAARVDDQRVWSWPNIGRAAFSISP